MRVPHLPLSRASLRGSHPSRSLKDGYLMHSQLYRCTVEPANLGHPVNEENSLKKLAILLVALFASIFFIVGCSTGVTVNTDSPVDIPEQVEAGGVTVQPPDEINVGGVQIETEDGRITAK